MILYDKQGHKLNLDENKELARGGEGKIIQINNKKVAKIYLNGISPITEDKFNSLYNLKSNTFLKPEKLLYNKQKKIEGFTMNILPPDFYPLYSALNSNFCNRHSIDAKYKLKMSEKLINAMSYVHSQDIIIGDFNPFNISINDKCNLIFIDVDSYETRGNKHSGRLLTEIRDYLYNGQVSKNSDYFALAVILFNFLTTVHPFKGIHKKYPALMDRMIKKLPIIKSDPELKVPKCYQPIKDKKLLEQFERIFINGERFLINLNPNTKIQVKQKIKIKQQDDQLMIFEILSENINYINSSSNKLCIHTKNDTLIYDVSYHGQFKEIGKLDKNFKTYPIKDKIFFTDGKYLYYTKNIKDKFQITNFEFENILYVNQYDDILIAVSKNMIYKIYLNTVINSKNHITGKINNDIKVEVSNVFGLGFKKYNTLIQYINGKTFMRYNSKNNINNVLFPNKYVKDAIQMKNVGVAQIFENDKVTYKLFNINGLKVEFDNTDIKNLKHIGYKDNSYVIIPEDDALSFRRIIDFNEIANFKCNLVDDNSEIFVTDAGIILNNGTGVYLINKK